MSTVSVSIVASVVLALWPSTALAAFQLRITSFSSDSRQTGQLVVTDQSHQGSNGDLNMAAGRLSYSGSVGDFAFSLVDAASKTYNSATPQAWLDSGVISIQSKGPGAILVELTDTNWRTSYEDLVGTFQGVSNTPILFGAYQSSTNEGFDESDASAIVKVASGVDPFSETIMLAYQPSGRFSLSIKAYLQFTDSETSSFQFSTQSMLNPEPATIVTSVFGIPFLGGCYLRRRNRNNKAAS